MAVAEDAVNRDGGVKVAVEVGIAVKAVRIGDGGEGIRADAEEGADVRVPGKGADIKQLSAGSVGVIAAELRPLCHLKNQPGIDRAGAQLLPGEVRGILQHPGDLRGRKIGGQPQAGPFPDHFGMIGKALADLRPTGALPDNRVVNRKTRLPVPDERGFPLVADTETDDVALIDAGLFDHHPDDAFGVLPDLHRVVGDPAVLRDLLLMGQVAAGDQLRRFIEQQRFGAGSALVDGQ